MPARLGKPRRRRHGCQRDAVRRVANGRERRRGRRSPRVGFPEELRGGLAEVDDLRLRGGASVRVLDRVEVDGPFVGERVEDVAALHALVSALRVAKHEIDPQVHPGRDSLGFQSLAHDANKLVRGTVGPRG